MHELSHAYMAVWQGDDTPAENGHLTLNPMVQMGPTSLIVLAIVGISWGAVPVNPLRMRHKWSHALVAFAGPLMNLILAILFCAIAIIVIYNTGMIPTHWTNQRNMFGPQDFFFWGATMNMVLFLFNLTPAPPLDGYTVASFLFPQMNRMNQELKNGLLVGLLILVFFSAGLLFQFAGSIIDTIIITILKIVGFSS